MPLPQNPPLELTLAPPDTCSSLEGDKASPLQEEVMVGHSSSPGTAQGCIAGIEEVPIVEQEAETVAVALAGSSFLQCSAACVRLKPL